MSLKWLSSFSASSNVRLVSGTISSAGRLEVLHHGIWGTVCDDAPPSQGGNSGHNTTNMANVVCRMLGFNSGDVKKNAEFGPGTGQIWLDNVNCSGNEPSLFDCQHRGWGIDNCDHVEDVGVVCHSNRGNDLFFIK